MLLFLLVPYLSLPFDPLPLDSGALASPFLDGGFQAQACDGSVGLQPGRQRGDETLLRAGVFLLDHVAAIGLCKEIIVDPLSSERVAPHPPSLLLSTLGRLGAGDLFPCALELIAYLRQPSILFVTRKVSWLAGQKIIFR